MANQLILTGLNSLDEEELKEALGDSGMEVVKPKVPEGSLAEPATITVVLYLGSIALTSLAVWLSKGRRRHYLAAAHKVVHPDGTTEEKTFELDESSEDAVKASVLAQLRNWVGPSTPGSTNQE